MGPRKAPKNAAIDKTGMPKRKGEYGSLGSPLPARQTPGILPKRSASALAGSQLSPGAGVSTGRRSSRREKADEHVEQQEVEEPRRKRGRPAGAASRPSKKQNAVDVSGQDQGAAGSSPAKQSGGKRKASRPRKQSAADEEVEDGAIADPEAKQQSEIATGDGKGADKAGKKRGPPKERPVPEKANGAAMAAAATGSGAPAPRRRGRPLKAGVKRPLPVEPKRPRGRPPKAGVKRPLPVEPKRPRGRPRKNPAAEPVAAAAAAASASDGEPGQHASPGPKRKAAKPRKNAPTEGDAPSAATGAGGTPSRKRGAAAADEPAASAGAARATRSGVAQGTPVSGPRQGTSAGMTRSADTTSKRTRLNK